MTIKFLLIISTFIGLESCCTPTKSIVHEIHYVPSYGATAPVRPKDRINPNMPSDAKSKTEYKNRRQYPERGMGRNDSV